MSFKNKTFAKESSYSCSLGYFKNLGWVLIFYYIFCWSIKLSNVLTNRSTEN